MAKHVTTTHRAELCSMTVGVHDNEPVLVLGMRLDPNSFEVTNLRLTSEQASRLWHDINNIMGNSESLRAVAFDVPNHYDVYEQIMLDKKVIRKKSKKGQK